ncbi:putative cytochrome P450 superfamily protein [Panicum miliaceum]|uniref:Cytochrome P450 superfamily protein n=1 Tax=Panicum miliaceum TaxID=4540 RepID=A0A3L6QV56_PANMI|nr:putative cytochrome P450 superfamily protein [Panicum miliaceum]
MDLSLVLALVAVALSVLFLLVTRARKPWQRGKLPPGSLGLPVIGQSLGLLRAMRANTAERWIQDRVDRYGPVSKLSLFGIPTVLLTGPAANKFVFFSAALASQQPRSMQRILGERNILELMGADHKRVRGALLEFLKPDMLRLYVGKIEGEVRRHLDENWAGRRTVTVLPLMKRLTFDIISLLLFGLERGAVRDTLFREFVDVMEGTWAVPLNLPFTAFSRSLKASARIHRVFTGIARETQAKLERGEASRSSDLIACLLSLTDDSGAPLLSEEEIVDNAMVSLIAGHDTSSILLTFLIRQLADDPDTLAAMVHEHDEIAKSKGDGEALTWEDLAKMKLTWRAAQEMLRMVPPVFGNFRRATKDIEFDGYVIPKGWQVFWTAAATHMDGGIYPEPAKFNPSRFETQSASVAPPCSFVAFGAGPRICVGMEFARIETLVALHYLLRRFRWKLCCKENTFVRDPAPSPLHGLPIELAEHKTASP